jgi:hypothetical protein
MDEVKYALGEYVSTVGTKIVNLNFYFITSTNNGKNGKKAIRDERRLCIELSESFLEKLIQKGVQDGPVWDLAQQMTRRLKTNKHFRSQEEFQKNVYDEYQRLKDETTLALLECQL